MRGLQLFVAGGLSVVLAGCLGFVALRGLGSRDVRPHLRSIPPERMTLDKAMQIADYEQKEYERLGKERGGDMDRLQAAADAAVAAHDEGAVHKVADSMDQCNESWNKRIAPQWQRLVDARAQVDKLRD